MTLVRTQELLTLREVAGELRCSVATVKRRVAAGELPAFHDGRLIRIRRDDLGRYIAERVTRSSSWLPSAAAFGVALGPGERLWD